jgi:hypothetical protein
LPSLPTNWLEVGRKICLGGEGKKLVGWQVNDLRLKKLFNFGIIDQIKTNCITYIQYGEKHVLLLVFRARLIATVEPLI